MLGDDDAGVDCIPINNFEECREQVIPVKGCHSQDSYSTFPFISSNISDWRGYLKVPLIFAICLVV